MAVGTPLGVTASGHRTAAPITPDQLAGLGLWYDADHAASFVYSSGAVVSQWKDRSPNARDMIQTTVASQPVRNGAMNGRTTVVFDGNDCWLYRSAVYTIAQPFTVLFVMDSIAAAGDETQTVIAAYGGAFQITTSAGYLLRLYANTPDLIATHAVTGAHVWRAECNGATSAIYRDRTLSKSGALGTAGTTTGMMLSIERGWGTADAIRGQLAELCLYERILSAGEAGQVENYLKSKWGTP